MQPENLINNIVQNSRYSNKGQICGGIPNSQIIKAYKIKYSSNQADNKSYNFISYRFNMNISIEYSLIKRTAFLIRQNVFLLIINYLLSQL